MFNHEKNLVYKYAIVLITEEENKENQNQLQKPNNKPIKAEKFQFRKDKISQLQILVTSSHGAQSLQAFSVVRKPHSLTKNLTF